MENSEVTEIIVGERRGWGMIKTENDSENAPGHTSPCYLRKTEKTYGQ